MAKSSRKARRARETPVNAPGPEVDSPVALPARITLTVVLALTPLCLLNGVFLSHDVIPKVILTLCGAAAVAMLFRTWATGVRMLWEGAQGKTFLVLLAAQCGSLVLSTVASNQPGLSLAGTLWRRFGAVEQLAALLIALAAAACAVRNRLWPPVLFRAIAAGGTLGSLYGILQYFGVDPFLDRSLYKIFYLGGIVRPPATMGHAIYFAAWLVPVAMIAAPSFWDEEEPLWKALHAATALLAVIAIFLSGSRGALIAVILAAGYFVFQVGGEIASRLRRQFGVAALVSLVGIAGLTLSPAGSGMRHRLSQWREDLGGPRLAMWGESPVIFLRNPIFGTGPETFAEEFRRIESESLSRKYPDFYNETPHNALIDAACAQGLPGLLILAGIFWFGIIGRRFGDRRSVREAGLRAAILGILTGSLFASFTIVQSMLLWSLAGICAALQPAPREANREARSPAWLSAPAFLSAAVFLAFTVMLSVPDAMYTRLVPAREKRDLSEVSHIFDGAESWSFGLPLAGYELFASRELAVLARSLGETSQATNSLAKQAWAKSADAAEAAEVRGEERFSAAYQASVLAIANGDLARAEAEARRAIALAPNWYRPHVFLAQILAATGKNDEALAEQKLGVQLAGTRAAGS